MYVTSQKPCRCWPRRPPGASRAEALSIFALTFLFLLPFCDLSLTYSSWRAFGAAPTRSRLGWRQPGFGEEKPSLAVRQNMQTSCSSLPDPNVQQAGQPGEKVMMRSLEPPAGRATGSRRPSNAIPASICSCVPAVIWGAKASLSCRFCRKRKMFSASTPSPASQRRISINLLNRVFG